jgi:hypothetical protein
MIEAGLPCTRGSASPSWWPRFRWAPIWGSAQPMEHVIRQTLISLRMGERLGLDAAELAQPM